MHTNRRDDSIKKSWSFISEDSFSSAANVPLDALQWEQFPESDDDEIDFATDLQRMREYHDEQLGTQRKESGDKHRKRTVTFQEDDIPVVSRKSSMPEPIQLLQETPRRTRTASGPNFFNHTLYGSLRSGQSVELYSKDYCGLAFSAAAAGFMVPFLERCFHPLLCDYLGLDTQQSDATYRFLMLPGIISFFIGVLSDFYPMWNLHRKAYIVLGWVIAYFTLMALVIIAMFDYGTFPPEFSFTRFQDGSVYVLLMMGTSLGVTIASVASFAFLVELSQREPIHERGTLVLTYVVTREIFTLASTIVASQIMKLDDETGQTKSVISMKTLLLLMAVIALIPIPTVLFRMEEDRRQLKVDSVDRLSHTQQLWRILQQEAVWRIILFICLMFFLSSFEFKFANDAVMQWADVDSNMDRIGQIPFQTMIILSLLTFRYTLLNYSWVRVSIVGLLVNVLVHLVTSMPIIYNQVRNKWFYLFVRSLSGLLQGAVVIVTTLPLVEITENCIEGATTGLVASYNVLINFVLLSISDWIDSSAYVERNFSSAVIARDESHTQNEVTEFLLLSYGINILALFPILYLLPRQKLDAQQMRTYGGYSKSAGITIAIVFVVLAIFAAVINVLALLHKLQ
ncbi:hypothetical protein FI667_g659, partial [Globisporangium splendens]